MTTQISPTPCVILPPDGSLQLSQFSVALFNILFPSASVLTILRPLRLFRSHFFPVCHTPFLCLCSRLSAAQSPTVTDPLQQAYAGVQHYAGDPSLLPPVLSHFLHLSLSLSPSLPLCLSHQWTLWQVEIAGPANFLPD